MRKTARLSFQSETPTTVEFLPTSETYANRAFRIVPSQDAPRVKKLIHKYTVTPL